MPLTPQQIKEEQLMLLQISGFCLSQYNDPSSSVNIFRQSQVPQQSQSLSRLNIVDIKSAGFSSNANLKAFICILLQTIYNNQLNEDLLDYIKSFLYSKEIDLTDIKNHSLPHYSNKEMKKLVVQFFYSLAYSYSAKKVEEKLNKYPIIMEILVMYLRRILHNLGISNAQNNIFRLNTKDTYQCLIQYFDLNCKEQGNLYLFYQDQFFIVENQHQEILFGSYRPNQFKNEEKEKFNFNFNQQSEDEDYESEVDSESAQQSPNRSLELRGLVSQSMVFDVENSTPFFNDDSKQQHSFHSSREPSLKESGDYQKEFIMKISKDMSPLKKMDRMRGSQQLGLGSILQMKKTIIFQEIEEPKQQNEPFQHVGESPITIDSQHHFQIPEEQLFREKPAEKEEQVKVLKKSKSEIMSKIVPAQTQRFQNASQFGISPTPKSKSKASVSDKSNKPCQCIEKKKKKIKLNSHLYDINMSYITPNFLKKAQPEQLHLSTGFSPPSTPSTPAHGQKSFAQMNYHFQRSFSKNTVFKKVNKVFHRTNLLDTSLSKISRYSHYNPQSDTFSRIQFSPLSNNSKSPAGGTKSITPPKVKFTYNATNNLKYSTHIMADKQKQRKYSRI